MAGRGIRGCNRGGCCDMSRLVYTTGLGGFSNQQAAPYRRKPAASSTHTCSYVQSLLLLGSLVWSLSNHDKRKQCAGQYTCSTAVLGSALAGSYTPTHTTRYRLCSGLDQPPLASAISAFDTGLSGRRLAPASRGSPFLLLRPPRPAFSSPPAATRALISRRGGAGCVAQ